MARVLLQIHDKSPGGGGIAQVVASYAEGLTERGWAVTDLRLSRRGEAGSVAVRPSRLGEEAGVGMQRLRAAAAQADVVLLHLGYSLLSPALIKALSARAALYVQLHDVSPFCPNGYRLAWPGHQQCEKAEGAGCLMQLCAGRGAALATARAGYRLATRRAVWRALCERAEGFLAPSRYLADQALHAGAGAARVHPLPLPLGILNRLPKGPVAPPSATGPVIGYVGLLSQEKGAALLLEAVALLPAPVQLVIYGTGPLAAVLRTRAARPDLAGRVSFAGQVGHDQLGAGLAQLRLLAHPSLVPEGFGLAGPEAMAFGRPVVGFGRGGSADWLIDGKTGLIAAQVSPAALASRMRVLLEDAALADRLGEAAARHAHANYATAPALDALAARLNPVRKARQSP